MKLLAAISFITFVAFGNTCTSKKSSHMIDRHWGRAYKAAFNPTVLKDDSLKLDEALRRLDWARRNPENTSKMVFAKTSVRMVEINEHVSDFKVYDYDYCEAVKTDSTLVVWLKQQAPYDLSGRLYEGINLEFAVYKTDYKTKIAHWSDTGMRPDSKVVYDYLLLSGNTYEKGDTIWGKLHVVAKTHKDAKQIFKGNFSAVIQ